jgi:hypothetical protein
LPCDQNSALVALLPLLLQGLQMQWGQAQAVGYSPMPEQSVLLQQLQPHHHLL